MAEDENGYGVRSEAQSLGSHARGGYEWHESEQDSLKFRVRKASGVMFVIFLSFWVLSVWRWPFDFLGDYVQPIFMASVIVGYVNGVLDTRAARLIFGKIANVSIELILAMWIFLPSRLLVATPWFTYLSIFSITFILTLTAAIFFGGSISDKYSRLSDRIGGFLHGIAFIVVVLWLSGTEGLLSPIGLAPNVFSDYLLPFGIGVYILGSVVQSASFPISWVAAERASYSIAWGCLGAIILTFIFRWIGFLLYLKSL